MGVTERLNVAKEMFCELAKRKGLEADRYVTTCIPTSQEKHEDYATICHPYLHHQTALRIDDAGEYTTQLRKMMDEFVSSYDGYMAIRRAFNPFLKSIADYTSLTLLELGAVKLNTKNPFTLASKNKSPVYVDNRYLITENKHKGATASFMAEVLDHELCSEINMVVGGETAGMAPAERLAQLVDLPYFYVRKEQKKHGDKKSVIVGNPDRLKSPALLVEDLITDAGSKLTFIDNLRAENTECNVIFVIFDRLQGGREALLTARSCELYSLSDLLQTVDISVKAGYQSEEDASSIYSYMSDPKKWNIDRGFEWFEPVKKA